MTYIRLGNLNTKGVEEYLGIKLTEEDFGFLNGKRVDKVSDTDVNYKIPASTWHAFDMPQFSIHCGSSKFAKEVTSLLSKYMVDSAFPNGKAARITYDTPKEEKFGYAEKQNMIDKNLEIYVGEVVRKDSERTSVVFYLKTKETEISIFLQEVKQTKDYSDIYAIDYSITTVPNVNAFADDYNDNIVKPVRKKKSKDDTYEIKDFFETVTIKKWDGEPIKVKF